MSFLPSYVNGGSLHNALSGSSSPNWSTNSFMCALFNGNISGQTPDTTERYGVGAYAANECPDSGTYAAGGQALNTPTLYGASAGTILFKDAGAASLVWTGVTFAGSDAPRGIAVYNDTITVPVGNPIICAINFGLDIAVTAGTMTVTWNSSYGLFYFQYA